MTFTENTRTQWLSTDEAYERFFDGYYNLGRPGEILGRNVIMSRPKVEASKTAARPADSGVARASGSTRNPARVK
jgi:hypothetical protein